MSLFETVGPLEEVGLICEDAVVLVDRQQGGKEHLSNGGINLHSVFPLTEILELLQQTKK
jgi:uridine monophosphate synthetase